MSFLSKTTEDRLRASIIIDIDEGTRRRHEQEIIGATRLPNGPVPHRRRSRLVLAGIVASVLLLPIGGAIAANDALPGDPLYPVKLATEPILSLFQSDVAAAHRVEELDRIVRGERDDVLVIDAVVNAEDAVRHLPADHPLRIELDRIRERITDEQSGTTDGDSREERDSTATDDRPSTDTVPADTPREPPPSDREPPPPDSRGAPPSDRRDG